MPLLFRIIALSGSERAIHSGLKALPPGAKANTFFVARSEWSTRFMADFVLERDCHVMKATLW
jgi:hypothetical protein